MSRNILVTGASGFVGRSIVHHLAKDSTNTIIATGRSNSLEFIHLKNVMYRQQEFSEPFLGPKFDICIHCAAKVDDRGTFDEFYHANVTKTKSLIQHLDKQTLFIYISTSSVYTFQDDGKMKEVDAVLSSQLSHYGATKLIAEQLIANSGLTYVVLRPRAIYGPGDTTLMPRIMRLYKNGYLFLPNHEGVTTSMTNIHFLCQMVESAFQNSKMLNQTFNVADQNTYDIHRVITHVAIEKYPNLRVLRIPKWLILILLKVNQFVPFSSLLSKQAVSPFLCNSVLDISKMGKCFKNAHLDFYSTNLHSSITK